LCLPVSQHKCAMQDREGGNYSAVPANIPRKGAMQHREGGNYPVMPASIPAQARHAASGGWKSCRCACQYPSTRVPCRTGRVEIIPLRLRLSQHKGAMQHREGEHYPVAPASIPAQVCHAGSGGWQWSRCTCQYPSTRVPCRIGRVEIIPLRLPVSQYKCSMQHREGRNYPVALASIPAQGCHAGSGGWKSWRCACQYPSTRVP